MEKLVLVYNQIIDGYSKINTENDIIHLGSFLTTDVKCSHVDFFKKLLNDPNITETGGDYSTVIKKGNKINIYFEVDYFEQEEDAVSFETTVQQMNYILDRWKEACEKKPNKIIITRDGDDVQVVFED